MNSEDAVSVQETIFQTLLKTPHRQVDETLALHLSQFERDPHFYGLLATWALSGHNAIRDLDEIFIAVLFASSFPEHREAAYVLLQKLPPYQVERVCNFYTGWDEIVRHRSYDKKPLPKDVPGVTVRRACYGKRRSNSGQEIPVKTVELDKNTKLRRELVKKGLVRASDSSFTVTTYHVAHAGLGKGCLKGM
ncbi:MAG: hypothetical protein WC364_14890, partial [Eubacteriales bacterium]